MWYLLPLKLAPTAYALDITTSVRSAPSNLASAIKAADKVLPLRFVISLEKSQNRRSRSVLATPFAWPMVFPTNALSQRVGSFDNGGNLTCVENHAVVNIKTPPTSYLSSENVTILSLLRTDGRPWITILGEFEQNIEKFQLNSLNSSGQLDQRGTRVSMISSISSIIRKGLYRTSLNLI